MITLVQTTSTQFHWKYWSQLPDKNLAHSLFEKKKKLYYQQEIVGSSLAL